MNDEMFTKLVESVKEMKAIMRGEAQPLRTSAFEPPDVKSIRKAMRLTQQQFAAIIGVSARTLQNWEQNRRSPKGPARVLLMVAARNPQVVLDVLLSGNEVILPLNDSR